LGLSGESVAILTKDSLKLAGYFIESQQDSTKGIIILVHGIGACKEHFLGLSASLAEKGIATFVFDGRAHGESEGNYCTYGFQEKHNISNLLSFKPQFLCLSYPFSLPFRNKNSEGCTIFGIGTQYGNTAFVVFFHNSFYQG
ncbi:MAG: hypothetical protein ACI85I_000408, partial [Arenicella sp.]